MKKLLSPYFQKERKLNVKEELRRAIKYGIYLGDLNKHEEKSFISDLFKALVAKKNFCSLTDKDRTIIISSIDGELAEAFIHEGTLKVIPLAAEGYFQVFMDVLEFLAERHKEELNEKAQDIGDDESTEEDEDADWWL